MKRPPNLVIMLAVAALAFGAIVGVKRLTAPAPPAPPGPWLTDEAAAFAQARATGKAVLLDITATWSMPSEQVSRSLDELVPVIDRHYIRVRIDVGDGTERDDELRARYGITTIPAVVMVSADGRVLGRVTEVLDTLPLRSRILAAVR